MREIKFRAFDGQEMYDSPYMHDEWGSLNHAIDDCIQHGQTLMQYTGLKDRNGREIYEGDVVKYDGREIDQGAYVIEWKHQAFTMIRGDDFWGLAELFIKDLEIIGNIYESDTVEKPKKMVYPKGTPGDLPRGKSGK